MRLTQTGAVSDEQLVSMFLSHFAHSRYTYRNYKTAIQRFRLFLENKPLQNVTWRDVEAYKTNLMLEKNNKKGLPLSPATITVLIAPLRSFYCWGSDPNIQLFRLNPTTCVKVPKITVNSRTHYLTKSELSLLLKQLKQQGGRDYLLGLMMVLLGLRVSEVIKVRWSDFFTDPAETGIWLTIVNGKGQKSRVVKVPKRLWKMIQHFWGKSGYRHKTFDDQRSLFSLTDRQVQRIIQHARKQCRIDKKVSPHWLRHTNATMALLYGASLQQVQENLGHAQLNTTQRYLHTVNLIKKAAPDFVEEGIKDIVHFSSVEF